MDRNKQILEFCPNFYKILEFTPYEDDKISGKLIKLYQKYIFEIDVNNEEDVESVKQLDHVISKYFSICNMPIVTSQYWNQVHGTNPYEVRKDEEGMQTMRTLGNNMAWLLKCIDVAKKNGVEYPENEKAVKTNFVR